MHALGHVEMKMMLVSSGVNMTVDGGRIALVAGDHVEFVYPTLAMAIGILTVVGFVVLVVIVLQAISKRVPITTRPARNSDRYVKLERG